ncbi:MAG TPA: hypothetical protein VNA69_04255 [Thermoanaerobaculia bacterium]|nr:hypothetical protein [Thermoanaerobaculia bacterium]
MSSAEHLSDERLAAYAGDPASIQDRAAVEEHLSACAPCWTRLDDYRTLFAAMRDEETWSMTEDIAGTEGMHAVRDLAARLEWEDEEAARMLRPVLESPYSFARVNIAWKGRFQTGGVVRLLCEAVRQQCDREPRFALAIADIACLIADTLPDAYYPNSGVNALRGTAWKEYSTACRYLALFDNGFDALNRAERAYRLLPDPAISLAAVALGRAAMLWEQQRWQEALGFARTAAQTYAERRDTKRYFEAREWEAMILHRLGDVPAARDTYRKTYDFADSIGDAEMKARAAEKLAIAYRDTGDMAMASSYLSIALQLFGALDQPALVLITRWSIARLALAGGNAGEAARRLPALVTQFEKLGMAVQAAHAQLDLAEAHLVLGRFDEAHAACSALIQFFRHARMLTGALTAAAYLDEAAGKRTLTAQKIGSVRDYLTALERTPDLPFRAPA